MRWSQDPKRLFWIIRPDLRGWLRDRKRCRSKEMPREYSDQIPTSSAIETCKAEECERDERFAEECDQHR